MSKKISAFFLLLTSSTIFFLLLTSPTITFAQQSCSVRTSPTPLISTNKIAGFYIDVGNNKNYDYRVEFKCGVGNFKTDAIKYGATEIYVGLDKTNTRVGEEPCEFHAGTHEINVYAIAGSSEVLQCTPKYTVVDSIYQCSLTIKPTEGITSVTPIELEGKNLTNGGRFVVFFDDDAIDIANNNTGGRAQIESPTIYVKTPEFGPKSIPQELMTPGYHVISLRTRTSSGSDWYNPIKQEKDFFGPSLCPIAFTVTAEGGKVVQGGIYGGGNATTPCTDDNCSKAGGDPCDDARGPGFKTAIGCIHTTPKALVEDVLKFATGIGGGLAFMMMLLGAFQMLTSGGNPQNLQGGRDTFQNAIIGLLFIIFSILLMKIIGIDILNIPGFSQP